jgi:hypothetical protein
MDAMQKEINAVRNLDSRTTSKRMLETIMMKYIGKQARYNINPILVIERYE